MNRRRKQNHRAKPQIKGWTIALRQYILPALLVVGVGLYSAKDFFYFDNGAGGADWKIGKPKVTWLNAQSQRPLPETRQFALSLVNRDRQVNGLAPLVEDPLLSQAAQTHAEDMLKRHYFAHKAPEGRMPSDRFAQVGGKGGAGENIAKQTGKIGASSTYGLVEQFQKGWMYSTGHRRNLLEPSYTRFGYGIATDSVTGEAYAAQEFARPQP